MKLLCALMVGSTCLSWFPKGTKKADIAVYSGFGIVCDPPGNGARGVRDCKKPLVRSVRVPTEPACKRVEWEGANRPPLLALPVGTEGSYACTKREVAAWAEEVRRANLSPLERQNEDAGK